MQVSTRRDEWDITRMVREDILTNGFVSAISSGERRAERASREHAADTAPVTVCPGRRLTVGNWSVKRFKMERSGVTQARAPATVGGHIFASAPPPARRLAAAQPCLHI